MTQATSLALHLIFRCLELSPLPEEALVSNHNKVTLIALFGSF